MAMAHYPVICYEPNCGAIAKYKIAAKWSDGVTQELKTYFLSCPACLSRLYEMARLKQAACRLAIGETLGEPEIYELSPGKRDTQLAPRSDLRSPSQGPSVS